MRDITQCNDSACNDDAFLFPFFQQIPQSIFTTFWLGLCCGVWEEDRDDDRAEVGFHDGMSFVSRHFLHFGSRSSAQSFCWVAPWFVSPSFPLPWAGNNQAHIECCGVLI